MIRAGVFLAAILGIGTPVGSAQISAGYVIEVRGEWMLNGRGLVKAAQKVPAGGSIRRRSNSADDRITIADLRGVKIAEQSCQSRCSGIVSLASTKTSQPAPEKSYAAQILDAITGASLLPSWSNRQARSGALSEGVALLNGRTIDISAVVKLEGQQMIKWRRFGDADSSWTKPVPMVGTVLTGFTSGVYEMALVRSNGSDFEPIATSLILVSERKKYDSDLAAFEEMKKLTTTWGMSVSAETRRSYLQASLRAIERGLE